MWNEGFFVVNLKFDFGSKLSLCRGCFYMHVTCLTNGLTETCSEMIFTFLMQLPMCCCKWVVLGWLSYSVFLIATVTLK